MASDAASGDAGLLEKNTRGGRGARGEHDMHELGLPWLTLQVPVEQAERDEGKSIREKNGER